MNRSRHLEFYRTFYAVRGLVWVQLVTAAILQSLTIFLIVYAVNQVISVQIPQKQIVELYWCVAGILLATFFISLTTVWMQKMALRETKRCSTGLRKHLAERCMRLSKSFRNKTPVSKLHNTLVQDTNRIDEACHAFLMDFVPSLITVLAINLILLFLQVKLYLLLISVVPFLLFVSAKMNKRMSLAIQKYHRAIELFSDYVLHLLQTLDLVHIQATTKQEIERQGEIVQELQGGFYHSNWMKVIHLSVQNFIVTIAALLILAVGGHLVITGSLMLGSLIAFYVGVGILKRYLMSLISSVDKILNGKESLLYLMKILNEMESHPYQNTNAVVFNGEISCRKVGFGFDDQQVLEDVSFEIKPGEITGIVGPNGSGKTTLMNLILGFYRPTKGNILASGMSYDEIDIDQLRKMIGVVTQTPILRTGTIWENIAYGHLNATDEEVREVARLSTAAAFIDQLPKGYKTDIGEQGVVLSGGQKQRISIARALMGRPKVLILDEPTNHLDQGAVAELLKRVKESSQSMAVVFISHHEELNQFATQKVVFS